MLTTNQNQYLRPDYLSPLPSTLDAKKSPLALLAQTCSQIGADSPNTKLLTSSDKANNNKPKPEHRDKLSPASTLSNTSANDLSMKSSFKPYEVNFREKSRSPEERHRTHARTPKSSSNTPLTNGRCNSNHSSSPRASPATRKTPTTHDVEDLTKSNSNSSNSSLKDNHTSSNSTSSMTSAMTNSTTDTKPESYKPTLTNSTSYLNGFSNLTNPGIPHPMDLMASSIMAQQQALKNGLNPYLEYARLKGSAGFPPVCRDPYCAGCSLSSHLMPSQAKSCPAGCTQCDHVSKASYLGQSAAAYAHAQIAALAAASQMPYVCNWIAGDANYCGKRFANSEELLQHLRTHTSLGSMPESQALSMLSPSLAGSHPLLHRTYPTPQLSPLTSARYHPYGKPSLLPPSPMTGFPLPHPGLPPYFSPYLYGPRLGASSSMHP